MIIHNQNLYISLQIAAKIGGSFGGVPSTPSVQVEQKTMAQAPVVIPGVESNLNNSGGLKRPLEEGNGDAEPPLKSVAMENDRKFNLPAQSSF